MMTQKRKLLLASRTAGSPGPLTVCISNINFSDIKTNRFGCRGKKRKLLPATPALLGHLAKLDGEGGADGSPPPGGGRGVFAQLHGGNGRPVRKRRATQFFGY